MENRVVNRGREKKARCIVSELIDYACDSSIVIVEGT
jgi:hypothetical protein